MGRYRPLHEEKVSRCLRVKAHDAREAVAGHSLSPELGEYLRVDSGSREKAPAERSRREYGCSRELNAETVPESLSDSWNLEGNGHELLELRWSSLALLGNRSDHVSRMVGLIGSLENENADLSHPERCVRGCNNRFSWMAQFVEP